MTTHVVLAAVSIAASTTVVATKLSFPVPSLAVFASFIHDADFINVLDGVSQLVDGFQITRAEFLLLGDLIQLFTKHIPQFIECFHSHNNLPGMKPLTEKTITSPEQLRSELACARLTGFAIDDGEIEPGLICIGAVILGIDQAVLGAVSIAGPTFRMKEELDMMTREVKHTAANISQLLGGRP